MPRKLPQNVIEMRGKSHQTKAEKEERRNSEPKMSEAKRIIYFGGEVYIIWDIIGIASQNL